MSYTVSSEATYDDLTYEEAERLYGDMELLQVGQVDEHLRPLFEAWCKETGFENNLLTISTVYQIKVLLSLARYFRAP